MTDNRPDSRVAFDQLLALLAEAADRYAGAEWGLATPDDVEALEMVQAGIAATHREVPWSVMSRGMAKTGEQLNSDELHLRAFWLQWEKLMLAERV